MTYTGMTYTDEAMKVWNSAVDANVSTPDEPYGTSAEAAAAVITDAMAEKDAEIARLKEALEPFARLGRFTRNQHITAVVFFDDLIKAAQALEKSNGL